jgi:L-fucose isomerase
MVATENDALNGLSMLFGHLLTGRAQMFSDVRTYWSPEAVKRVTGHELTGDAAAGVIHLINSGPTTLDATGQQLIDGKPGIKQWWNVTAEDAQKSLAATTWHPGGVEYFRGGGWSSHFVTKGGMPVTMSRLNLVSGQGPVLQIAEGMVVELPEDVHNTLDLRTNPTWPTTWFVPRTTGVGPFRDVYSVMNNWGANHGAISYGHIGADLIALASMLRIPVYMHNVPDEKVFRPGAWTTFGAQDPMGADFRACANFGPLYG